MATKKTLIASVDVGNAGSPGSSASEFLCSIWRRADGRYDCEGSWSIGCNQGYYQENYSHGPWRGRGDTTEEAVADMVTTVPDKYQGSMRRAGHDALLEAEDSEAENS